jgi:hypothetical protein
MSTPKEWELEECEKEFDKGTQADKSWSDERNYEAAPHSFGKAHISRFAARPRG